MTCALAKLGLEKQIRKRRTSSGASKEVGGCGSRPAFPHRDTRAISLWRAPDDHQSLCRLFDGFLERRRAERPFSDCVSSLRQGVFSEFVRDAQCHRQLATSQAAEIRPG